MKVIDLAYTAGLMDGEGSVCLSHRSATAKYRSPVVIVPSTTYELLAYLKQHFGGYICTHKKYQPHHREHWSWRLADTKAIEFLRLIQPYIKEPEKRRRINLVVSKYHSVTPRNGKYTDIGRTNKLAFEHAFFHPSTP